MKTKIDTKQVLELDGFFKRFSTKSDDPKTEVVEEKDIEKAFSHISDLYIMDQISDEIYNAAKERYEIQKAQKEKLIGGRADGKTLEDIAAHHNIEVSALQEQYKMGMEEEKEHTSDEEERSEITKDHLMEDSKYYTKLEKNIVSE